jgi:acyl-CoA synthetase (NDP forming)
MKLGKALLDPSSVALIGASDDASKTTARPLRFMIEQGFKGRSYPINPRRKTVLGIRSFPSLAALPEVPEFVFILTGTATVIDTVRQCGELGVSVVCVLAGGFSEEGYEGVERQNELLQVARHCGVRVLGPNSIGVVNPRNGFFATANAAFAEPQVPTGTTFVASQSGSVIGALMTRAKAVGIGFAGLVSTGGEVDLSLGEICEATLDDPGISSYALFIESLENARSLARFAALAAERGKGVSVLKLGRSDAAAQLSVSHTGALAGADDEADAFFAACGFVRVDTFEALVESTPLHGVLPMLPLGNKPRVGVITSTGGGAAVLVDQLEMRGVTVVKPSELVFAEFAENGIDVGHNLIVDLTLAGTRHDKVLAALGAMQRSGEFDFIVFVIGSSARLNPDLAVRAIAESVGGDTPVGAWALPDALESLKLLHSAGVPAFRTPESCADALAGLLARSGVQTEALEQFRTIDAGEITEVLDEVASAAVLDAVGVCVPRSWVLSREAEKVIPADAYPVVVKALSADLPHKSDAGAVILNVRSEDDLDAACNRILTNVAAYDADIHVDRFLVQEMITDGILELLVGYRVSETVGPLVVVAAGGVNVELYRDSAVRLAPVTRQVAVEMLAEVRAIALAQGYRNGPIGDVDSLVDTVVAISQLADQAPDVIEAEVNPLVIRPKGSGVFALDALVRLRGSSPDKQRSSTTPNPN